MKKAPLFFALLMACAAVAYAATAMTVNGDVLFSPDDTYNIGGSTSANRPKNVYASTKVYAGSNVESDSLTIGSTGANIFGPAYFGSTTTVVQVFQLSPNISRPTCADTYRGTIWYTPSGSGVKDALEVCAKDAANSYAWRTLW